MVPVPVQMIAQQSIQSFLVSFSFQCNGDDGPLARQTPIYLLYLEEWRFSSGHYQSLVPDPAKVNHILSYLEQNRSFLSNTNTSTPLSQLAFHPLVSLTLKPFPIPQWWNPIDTRLQKKCKKGNSEKNCSHIIVTFWKICAL